MGVEVDGFEVAPPPTEALAEADRSLVHEKGNGRIEQGSNPNADVANDNEAKKALGANLPKDVVDEWPAEQKVYSFYFPKIRTYDDPQIKVKIDLADREIQRMNQLRFQITDKIRTKRSDRGDIISQLKGLGDENKQFNMIVDEKRKEMEPLHDALGKLRNTGSVICSSEEELNELIRSLNYRIQHESIPLAEEKQLLREIKQLEATREKVIANAALRADVQGKYGQREEIQDQVKLMGAGLDGVRKDQQVIKAKIKHLREQLEAIENDIKALQDELSVTIQKRDKAYEGLQELRKRRDEANAPFYQNRVLLNAARDLAAKKDIGALEELSHNEGEKFFSTWSGSKSFRDDYERRILPSLDSRQFTRDGRMRNPNEKPLVVVEERMPTKLELVVKKETATKADIKRPKEDSKSSPPDSVVPSKNTQKDAIKKPGNSSATLDLTSQDDTEELVVEKPKKELSKVKEVDEETSKEMKRQEQIEKQKQALERKKKLAEKNAAKAAIKAQKEAEKKLKEREKKAKKKAGAADVAEELAEDTADPEKVETAPEKVEALEKAPGKKSQAKHKFKGRPKGTESVPALLKRKKSTNYWMWAVPAAVLGVLVPLVFAYWYIP